MKSLALRPSLTPLLDDFFSNDFFGLDRAFNSSLANVNSSVEQLKDGSAIYVVAPGLKKEDFKISVDDNYLTVSFDATKKEKTFVSQKKFTQSWLLSKDALTETITASYDDGVLRVHVPIEQVKKEPKTIDVS